MEVKCYTEGDVANIPQPVLELVLKCLTLEEAALICQQFQCETWHPNNQVMWTGMLREQAQLWADEHTMQTLTTAMGPLMDPKHPSCLKRQKSVPAWSKYIKGASALFAYYISRGKRVVVLSPPPPDRFHPCGGTNYQDIEEPILKRAGSLEIEMVHPSVKGAESFSYQIWPIDMTYLWVERFGILPDRRYYWRAVKSNVTLKFNENREACLPCSTPDINPFEATARGRDLTILTLQGPEPRQALNRKVQQAGLAQKDAKLAWKKEGKVAVEKIVKEKAAKDEAAAKQGHSNKTVKKEAKKAVEKTVQQETAEKKVAKDGAKKQGHAEKTVKKEGQQAAKKKLAKAVRKSIAKQRPAKESTKKKGGEERGAAACTVQ